MVGTLGLQNQWGMPPKCCTLQFENWNLTENCHPRNTSNAQSRNYNEVTVQSICHNIHNRFQLFFLCLVSPKGGLATQSTLTPPPLNLPLTIHLMPIFASSCSFWQP